MSNFDLPLSIVLGVGLAAATGFRVFLPMLIVSGAAYTGHLPLADSFAWLGTTSALTMLGVAAIVEILAYYVPGVDNLLDSLATPAAQTVFASNVARTLGDAPSTPLRPAAARQIQSLCAGDLPVSTRACQSEPS